MENVTALYPRTIVKQPRSPLGEVECIINYPWLTVVRFTHAAGSLYEVSLSDDTELEDVDMLHECILPSGVVMTDAREDAAVPGGRTLTYWAQGV